MKFHSKALSLVLAATAATQFVTANMPGGGPGGYAAYDGHYQQQQQQYQQQQQVQQQPQGQWYGQPDLDEERADSSSPDAPKEDENPPLPPGWSEHFDPNSGQFYYYNMEDGTTTWDRPEPEEGQVEPTPEESPESPLEQTMEPVPEEDEPISSEPDPYASQRNYGMPEHDANQFREPESPRDEQGRWGVQPEPKPEEPVLDTPPIPQEPNGGRGEQIRTQPKPWETPGGAPPQGMERKENTWEAPKRDESPPRAENKMWGVPPQENRPQPGRVEESREYGDPEPSQQQHREQQAYSQQQPPSGWGAPKQEEPTRSAWGAPPQNPHPQKSAPPSQQMPPPSQQMPPPSQQMPPSAGQGGRPDAASFPPTVVPGFRPPMGQEEQQEQQPPPKQEPPRPYGQQPPQPQQQQPQQQRPSMGQPPLGSSQQPPQQQQPPPGQYGQYGQPPPRYGQPGQYGQYGQGPPPGYGQYGGQQGYRQPPPQTQAGAGTVIAKGVEEGSSAVKEALGSTWQSLVGFGSKTRELTEQVRDQVVTGAAAAGQSLSAQSTSIWGRARSAVGSVFEGSSEEGQQQPYSMTGTHSSQTQIGSSQGPPPGYPQQQLPPGYPPQQLDGRYWRGPGQHPPQQPPPQEGVGGGPPKQIPYGGRPMQPWGDAPYPHTQRGPPQQRPPMQSQYGNFPPQQQRHPGQQGGYPPRPGGAPQGGPPPGGRNPYGSGPPPQQRGPPPQQQDRPRPDPWSHPGLSGDL